jgi:hypothetical protein
LVRENIAARARVERGRHNVGPFHPARAAMRRSTRAHGDATGQLLFSTCGEVAAPAVGPFSILTLPALERR